MASPDPRYTEPGDGSLLVILGSIALWIAFLATLRLIFA